MSKRSQVRDLNQQRGDATLHIKNQNNPHNVTAEQLGLGFLLKYNVPGNGPGTGDQLVSQSNLQKEIDELNNVKLQELEDRLDTLDGQLTTLNGELDQLQTDLNTLDSELSTLDTELTNLDTELTNLDNILGNPPDSATFYESIVTNQAWIDKLVASQAWLDNLFVNNAFVDRITASEIASNTITANEIGAGVVTSNEINVSELAASTAWINEVIANSAWIDEIIANNVWTNKLTANEINVSTIFAQSASITGTLTMGTNGQIINTGSQFIIDEDGIRLGTGSSETLNLPEALRFGTIGNQSRLYAIYNQLGTFGDLILDWDGTYNEGQTFFIKKMKFNVEKPAFFQGDLDVNGLFRLGTTTDKILDTNGLLSINDGDSSRIRVFGFNSNVNDTIVGIRRNGVGMIADDDGTVIILEAAGGYSLPVSDGTDNIVIGGSITLGDQDRDILMLIYNYEDNLWRPVNVVP